MTEFSGMFWEKHFSSVTMRLCMRTIGELVNVKKNKTIKISWKSFCPYINISFVGCQYNHHAKTT